MSCGSGHPHIQWTQLIPIEVLCQCKTKMPESVLDSLWGTAESDGEVSEDIPGLRAPTLVEMFCHPREGSDELQHSLIEAK